MTFRFFDSHAHLSFPQFGKEERPCVFSRALDAHVTHIMNVATDEKTLQEGFELTPPLGITLYQAAATPPHALENADDAFFKTVSSLVKSGKLSAIGETGFDFFHTPYMQEVQEIIFSRYLELAINTGLPLIVHCRNAFEVLIPLLKNCTKLPRGVLHCFTGTVAQAKLLLDLGWFLSFSGIVTYKKSQDLRDVAAFTPLEHLLIETDAPYLPPEGLRGKRNEPAFITHTASTIATIKAVSVEQIAKITFENGQRLFGS